MMFRVSFIHLSYGFFMKQFNRASFILLLFLFVGLSAQAQFFGKNKVQYHKFNWYYIQSEHFDVYFADDGYDIAAFAARAAEDALSSIQRTVQYRITARVPIIVYNSHNAFQQTNVVGIYLEEGIGGVTEMFKNRVVIPFEGNYAKFRHVLHHELVHAVINDMFYGGSLQAALTNRIRLVLPLWMNEGLCEYESLGGWDKDSDMFLRDAVTSNYLPPIPYLSGYFAYRGGQSVWWYISEKYGEKKVGDVLNSIRSERNLDAGLKKSIGLNLEELSERWMNDMKRLYYPDIATRESPRDFARRLTDHTRTRSFYNTSPTISPAGDQVAFLSNRDDYFSVFVMSAIDGSGVRKVLQGSTTKDFEDLNLLTPGLSWSPDGKRLALASKSGGRDAVSLIDVASGSYEQLPIRKDGISSVQWSPDGKYLAFIGNTPRQSDIYLYDLENRAERNITDDVFSDAHPSWSHDGRYIYFVSDRGDMLHRNAIPADFSMNEHDYSQTDVYRIDVESGDILRITNTPDASESYPIPDPKNEKLLFISDRNGINNLYVHDFASGSEYAVSNSLSGIYQISLTTDGNKLAFASMHRAGFDIFVLKSPFELEKIEELEETEFLRRRNAARDALAARSDSSAKGLFGSEGPELHRHSDDVQIALGMHRGEEADTSRQSHRLLFGSGLGSTTRSQDARQFTLNNTMTDEGEFIINRYKLNFSADLVYGNAGYSTFYGVLGTTQMAFSDMLGDHQLIFLTNLIGDLKNSDYALAYYYLPGRIDWGIQGFHSARFLLSYTGGFYDNLYRYRQYGASLFGAYPFDRFRRVEATLTFMNISAENLDNPNIPISERTLVVPNIGYVHDNTLWGMWSPVRGSRYELRAFGSPGLGSSTLTFMSATADYRRYWKFWDDFSFVLRGSGGASFGANPQRFFIGGTDNWINRTFENGRIPIENEEDFAFLQAALPLRGYNYNARITTRYLLWNTELRFPVVKYFLGGVLPYVLQMVNGALFLDVGAAFNDIDSFRPYRRDADGNVTNQDLLVGTGFGTRMWFLGFPIKFDVAWAHNGEGFSSPKYYFSLGADF
jgi:Tol biopolymer transport system component